MEIKSAEIKSGAFIVLAVLVFLVLLFAVGDLKSRLRAQTEYYTYISDAKFLKVHDPVTFGGLRVGEIDRVSVPSDRFGYVKVFIVVNKDIEVREDSFLSLKQDGMLGSKYLEIDPGTKNAAIAKPGAELKSNVIPAITDLSGAVKDLLEDVKLLLKNANAIVGNPENQKGIAKIIDETKDLIANINKQLGDLAPKAGKTIDKASDLIDDAKSLIEQNRPTLDTLLTDAGVLVQKLHTAADDLTRLLRDGDNLIVRNNTNIYETIRALRDTAYHLEQASKRIRANPSILLFGAKETPEERTKADETELRRKGRVRRFDKEDIK